MRCDTSALRPGSSQDAVLRLDTLRGKAPRFRRLARGKGPNRRARGAEECQPATPANPGIWDDPLTPCRKSSIVVWSPRLAEPRAEAGRHIERPWFRQTTGSG